MESAVRSVREPDCCELFAVGSSRIQLTFRIASSSPWPSRRALVPTSTAMENQVFAHGGFDLETLPAEHPAGTESASIAG